MSFEKNATMLEYRVTKYDPAIRSDGGRYTEWTSVSDVGAAFDGTVLTQTAYEEVEAAYIAVATAFLRETDVASVSIRGLEHRKDGEPPYSEGDSLTLIDAGAIMAKVLREDLWCRLEGDGAFVHFGWGALAAFGTNGSGPKADVQLRLPCADKSPRTPHAHRHPDL